MLLDRGITFRIKVQLGVLLEFGRRISPAFLSPDEEKEDLCDPFLAFFETPSLHFRTTVTIPLV